MVDRRQKDTAWQVADEAGTLFGRGAHLAVLMDIRDELKALNQRLNCWEVTEGFRTIKRHHRWAMKRWPMPKKKPQRRKRK